MTDIERPEGLGFQDRYQIGRIKKFRARSLRNPKWIRDPNHVLSYLEGGVIPTASEDWPSADSPLLPWLETAVAKAKAFRRYARGKPGALRSGNVPTADAKWSEVLCAVDAVITEAERLAGRRL